jgi:tRNA-specific 2-thiouridylase
MRAEDGGRRPLAEAEAESPGHLKAGLTGAGDAARRGCPVPRARKSSWPCPGGVDSSVAALLLKRQGYDVTGRLHEELDQRGRRRGALPVDGGHRGCPEGGRAGGDPFQVVNLMRDYREKVVQYLLDGYARGLTPNPDIMCNREIKFGVFRSWAREHGFTAVATGHYARREALPGRLGGAHRGGRPQQGPDLFPLPPSPGPARDARFPIGGIEKPELRRIAREAGLATADKKDSQGICFIGEVRMSDFLRAYVPDRPGPGRARRRRA